jgi:hypothetical protein
MILKPVFKTFLMLSEEVVKRKERVSGTYFVESRLKYDKIFYHVLERFNFKILPYKDYLWSKNESSRLLPAILI